MTRPYTAAELRKYIKKIPLFEQGDIVDTVLINMLELCDEYYDAGYQEGRSDALSEF